MALLAGSKLRASDLSNQNYANLIGGFVATGATQILTAGTATSETDLGTRARAPSITFTSGHTYLGQLSIGGSGSVVGDSWGFYMRLVAAVGGGGSILFTGNAYLQLSIATNGFDITKTQTFLYVPSSTFTSQVFVSYQRLAGSGNLNVYGKAFTSVNVFDCGVANVTQT